MGKKKIEKNETVVVNAMEVVMNERLSKIEELVKDFNDKKSKGVTGATLDKLESEIQDAVKAYNKASCKKSFDELKNSGAPLHNALLALTYPTVKVTDRRTSNVFEDTEKTKVVESSESNIDFELFWTYCDKKIGVNHDWLPMCHKLNLLMTRKVADDLGIDVKDINDSFAMRSIAKQIDLGDTPCSKTKLLKLLDKIVQSMIGTKFKCNSHDVNYILSVYSKKSRKALTVTTSNNRQLVTIICEICHKQLTDKSYEIEYKKVKNA